MSKILLPPSTVLAPVPAVMVSVGDSEDNYNIISISWTGTICSRPPMTYVSLRPATHSYHIIEEKKEFVINLCGIELLETMDWCGRISGRDQNKWKARGLSPMPGKYVKAPLIAECPINIECAVCEAKVLGSHTMFIANIMGIHVDDAFISEGMLDTRELRTFANVNSGYMPVEGFLHRQGFSVEK